MSDTKKKERKKGHANAIVWTSSPKRIKNNTDAAINASLKYMWKNEMDLLK